METSSYDLSSGLPGPTLDFEHAIRGHWVREALWAEDQTRSRHWYLNANLAVLRAGLIALRAQTAAHLSWPQLFEHCAHQPAFPLRLLSQPAAT